MLEVEAVRIFDWLSPDHEFPVGRMDSRNVRILERALQGSRMWVIRDPCAISGEFPRPAPCIIGGRKWTPGCTHIEPFSPEEFRGESQLPMRKTYSIEETLRAHRK